MKFFMQKFLMQSPFETICRAAIEQDSKSLQHILAQGISIDINPSLSPPLSFLTPAGMCAAMGKHEAADWLKLNGASDWHISYGKLIGGYINYAEFNCNYYPRIYLTLCEGETRSPDDCNIGLFLAGVQDDELRKKYAEIFKLEFRENFNRLAQQNLFYMYRLVKLGRDFITKIIPSSLKRANQIQDILQKHSLAIDIMQIKQLHQKCNFECSAVWFTQVGNQGLRRFNGERIPDEIFLHVSQFITGLDTDKTFSLWRYHNYFRLNLRQQALIKDLEPFTRGLNFFEKSKALKSQAERFIRQIKKINNSEELQNWLDTNLDSLKKDKNSAFHQILFKYARPSVKQSPSPDKDTLYQVQCQIM